MVAALRKLVPIASSEVSGWISASFSIRALPRRETSDWTSARVARAVRRRLAASSSMEKSALTDARCSTSSSQVAVCFVAVSPSCAASALTLLALRSRETVSPNTFPARSMAVAHASWAGNSSSRSSTSSGRSSSFAVQGPPCRRNARSAWSA